MRSLPGWYWCDLLAGVARAGVSPGAVMPHPDGAGTDSPWERLAQGDTVAEVLESMGAISRWEATRLYHAAREGEGAAFLKEAAAAGRERLARRGDFRAGLLYPVFVLLLCGAAALFTALHLLPALLPTLQSVGPVVGYPPATRALLWAAPRWRLLGGAVTGAVVLLGLAVAGKLGWAGDRLARVLPGVGQAVQWRERAALLELLAQAARGGGLTGETVRLMAATGGRPDSRRRLAAAAHALEAGLSPAQALVGARLLPPELGAPLRAAELTGETSSACRELAVFCRSMQRGSEKAVLALLEPGLILVGAVLAGSVALAVVQPLYLSISQFL